MSLYRDVGIFVDISVNGAKAVAGPPPDIVVGDPEAASFTILAVALGVGIGAVLLLIVVVALLVVHIKRRGQSGSKEFQEDPVSWNIHLWS